MGMIYGNKETESNITCGYHYAFLGLLVFMLVSRKSQTGDSQPQSTTQDR